MLVCIVIEPWTLSPLLFVYLRCFFHLDSILSCQKNYTLLLAICVNASEKSRTGLV